MMVLTCGVFAGRDVDAGDTIAADAIERRQLGLCKIGGEACWKVKRAAEAFAEALAEPDAEAYAGK